jgi:hypothetical protein
LKMLPQFWRNQLSKKNISMALLGSCFSFIAAAQSTPLATPPTVAYPGILQTFEKIIQIDLTKFKNRTEYLTKNGKVFTESNKVTELELEPDFLNSIILHSNPGYLKLASINRCRFYDTILTDLLKSAEGKIRNVLITFVNSNGEAEAAIITKKDFLNKVVTQQCPETTELINKFQVRSLDETLKNTLFEIPSGRDQCRNIHLNWLNNSKAPYLCQIHEYIKEARAGEGDSKDLAQRRAVANVLDKKLSLIQKDYLESLCSNLDNEELFCDEFLNVSFWSKLAAGYESPIYATDICQKVMTTPKLSTPQLKQCLARLRKENDLCLYTQGMSSGLSPQMECDSLSHALNHSTLRSNYQDCPGNSDQFTVTNMARLLFNISKGEVKSSSGPCSAVSAGETLLFNQKFDNEENWDLEACYDNKLLGREVCTKTFMGSYAGHPFSYTNVVAGILRDTRGADQSLVCNMVSSEVYNPLLLEYKSGCHIIFEKDQCFTSQCKHKILYNNRPIDFIRVKSRLALNYFPLTVREERFSQHYLLTRDYKQKAKAMMNLSSIKAFYKKSKSGIMYGIGCSEDILPSFFKAKGLNQCTPIPFIIDGIVKDGEQVAFVARTAADSLQAPRLVSWSNIYSAVKTYQKLHPLKLWTLYGLD